jgi:hypothetical protein
MSERSNTVERDRSSKPKLSAIEEINREFAIVKTGGIICPLNDDKVISTSKLKDWLANRGVTAAQWLSSPDRREYESIVFRPGEHANGDYNLWKGFSVKASPKGSCDLFHEHVREHVCRGNERHYEWVMSFFAEIVQAPMEKSGVSLVIRGASGAGKTVVGEVIGSLFPQHYMLVDSPEQVIGRFNAHMARLLLLQADDTFFHDTRNAGKLRSLVTRHEHVIEPKGVDAYRVPNYMRLFITSEEDWVVPASLRERRFAIFDIKDEKRGDTDYFARMFAQLDRGGRARLLHDLMNFDMVELRDLPQTRALKENKLKSLGPDMKWWVNCLERGAITGGVWNERITRDNVFASYRGAMPNSFSDRSTRTELGIFLRKVTPWLRGSRGEYMLPTLKECRDHFHKLFQVRIGV